MKHSQGTTLYNVLFPIWLLWLFPTTWIAVLPGNFIIDLAVVVIAMKILKVDDLRLNAKAVILRVWLMGFVADFIGTVLMFGVTMLDFSGRPFDKWWYDNVTSAISYRPFSSVWSILIIAVIVALTGFLIYWFNRSFCLKKAALTEIQRKKLALSLAVFTAPYLFFLPSQWFY